MDYIFVSHSSKDKLLVDKICAYLESKGINCWVDNKNISGGDDFMDHIVKAIASEDCLAVLLVLSYYSIDSWDVNKELTIANSHKKRIIPYQIIKMNMDKRQDAFFFLIANSQIIPAAKDPLSKENLDLIIKAIPHSGKVRQIERQLEMLNESEIENIHNSTFYAKWGKLLIELSRLNSLEEIVLCEQALVKLERAIELDPSNSEFFENAAIANQSLGSLKQSKSCYLKARDYYERATALQPENYLLFWGQARVLAKLSEIMPEEQVLTGIAIQNYSKALQLCVKDHNLLLDWANFISDNYANSKVMLIDEDQLIFCCDKLQKAFLRKPNTDEIRKSWESILAVWGDHLQLQHANEQDFYDINIDSSKPDPATVVFLHKLANAHLCIVKNLINLNRDNNDTSSDEIIIELLQSSIGKYLFLTKIIPNIKIFNNLGVALSLAALYRQKDEHYLEAFEYFEKTIAGSANSSVLLFNEGILLLDWFNVAAEEHRDSILVQAIDRFEACIPSEIPAKDIYNSIGTAFAKRAATKANAEKHDYLKKAISCYQQAAYSSSIETKESFLENMPII